MEKTIYNLRKLNERIDETLDNLGTKNFDDGIPFHIEYNGANVNLLFCPESVERMQKMILELIEIFEEDYL